MANQLNMNTNTPKIFYHERINIHYGDIFDIDADAIVHPTNLFMHASGELGERLYKLAGRTIVPYINQFFPGGSNCKPGESKYTPGFESKYRVIIHTVRPVIDKDNLGDCYKTAIAAADAVECLSIVFPCICTGSHGYPMADAVIVALTSLQDALAAYPRIHVTIAVQKPLEQEIWRAVTE